MGNEKNVFKKLNFKFIFEKKKINEILMYKIFFDYLIKSSDVVEIFY